MSDPTKTDTASASKPPAPKGSAASTPERVSPLLTALSALQDVQQYQELHWDGSFSDYLDIVSADPNVARNAYQRLYDLIMHFGTETYTEFKKDIVRYRFFDDPFADGKDAVFGLDVHLEKFVRVMKSAALGYGSEKRVILLHGPVGSAKSTIVRLIKKGLEWYSRQPEGKLYTFEWRLPDGEIVPSPLHEDPLKLIPRAMRQDILDRINSSSKGRYPVRLEGDLDPVSRFLIRAAMSEEGGDIMAVMSRIRVKRLILSEQDRVGIGTFQPKDEKNQDSTELTGDINYRKIAEYGSDSDPRAFNFDGEFCIANRGMIEFVEMLKLDVAFLYDLLGASQEHVVKPKKFAQTAIDEVIIGHTNEPEFRKLQNNEFMEALRDRTIKIDIPYITKWQQEARIYKKDFNADRVKAHVAPHTLEMAAMWAVLTRLEEPKSHNLTLVQKMRLYDGKTLPGFTEDNVKELRKAARREGLQGISPRYIQDKISNALVREADGRYINPFMVLNELEAGLDNHSLIADEDLKKHYRDLLGTVKKEYEDIVKNEVQKAIASDEEAITRMCGNYIDNVKAYCLKEKVRNAYTGDYEEPDERMMRAIEGKIDIADARKDDFRRELMNYIGGLAIDGKIFDFRQNERLHRALELKLFEDQKDSIKLTSLVSQVVDKDTQAKIDIVKQRLIDNYGYDDQSATDVLNFVASIFARGDARKAD